MIQTIVSLTLLGAALGSIIGGPASDKLGRKPTLMIADVLFTIGAIIMGAAPNIPVLMLGRIVVGLGVGMAAMAVPVYLSEASPTEIRGMLVCCNVLFITSGQLISYLVCLSLGDRWRWMLGLAGVPSVLQFLLLICMPETPSYLYKNNRQEQAE